MAATVKSQKLVDDERLDISKYKEFTLHPAMKLIPHMREHEFEELKEDIRQNGMKQPILFSGTQLLDGLHRYVAWKELKKKERMPQLRFHGKDVVGEIISRNIHRRHLSDDQRAFIVTEARREAEEAAAASRKGARTDLVSKSTQGSGRTHEKLAETADVTPYKARQAIDVSKFGTPTEKAEVSAGAARLKDVAPKARNRAAKAGKRKAKPKKEVDKMSEKYVVKKFKDFLDKNWAVTQHRAVKAIIRPLTAAKP
jgi:hypothetical protein